MTQKLFIEATEVFGASQKLIDLLKEAHDEMIKTVPEKYLDDVANSLHSENRMYMRTKGPYALAGYNYENRIFHEEVEEELEFKIMPLVESN